LIASDSTLVWRTARRCDNGTCVEVAQLPSGMALRDSTMPDGPILSVSRAEWTTFVANLDALHQRRS
jgi:hypothetical protein